MPTVKKLQSGDVNALCLFHVASFLCTRALFIDRLNIDFETFDGQVGRMAGAGFLLNDELYVVNENLDSASGVDILLDVADRARWEGMVARLATALDLNKSMVHMDKALF